LQDFLHYAWDWLIKQTGSIKKNALNTNATSLSLADPTISHNATVTIFIQGRYTLLTHNFRSLFNIHQSILKRYGTLILSSIQFHVNSTVMPTIYLYVHRTHGIAVSYANSGSTAKNPAMADAVHKQLCATCWKGRRPTTFKEHPCLQTK
jgi:hypothetical protein